MTHYRKVYEVTGYTADADTYCPACAAKRYPAKCTRCGKPGRLSDPGWHDTGECDVACAILCLNPALRHGYFAAFDREGNEVHPIHLGDEWDYQPCCSDCGAEIDCTVLYDDSGIQVCPRCGAKCKDDQTINDHGMCYDCLKAWQLHPEEDSDG